MTSNSSTPIY